MAVKNLNRTSTSNTEGQGRASKRDRATPVTLMILIKTLTLMGVGLVAYLLAVACAVSVIPVISIIVADTVGITENMAPITTILFWVLPVVFLSAVLFVAYLLAVRATWRLRKRLVNALALRVLGEAPRDSVTKLTSKTKGGRERVLAQSA